MKRIDWDQALTLLSPHSYALVSTVDVGGRPNLMGVGWWSIVSWEPRMLAVSIGRRRHTRGNLDQVPEFVLCFPNADQARGAWLCGTASGADVDKFKEGGFQAVPSASVRPPRFEGATVAIECKVAQRVEVGDHVLYIGDIVAMHGSPDQKMHLFTLHYRTPVAIDCDLNVKRHLDV
jgi:flavin reductase (DIM6/NTAB) family NADH-FMN oxidoreductase RutF